METSLIQIDRSGFFPDAEESKTHFVLSYQELFSRFSRDEATIPYLVAAKKQFYELFATIPCWVHASITSVGIFPWELAACWQYSDGQSLLRMRARLDKIQEQDRLAVLMHELVHAVRARLHSICFEEILAFEVMKTLHVSTIYRVRSLLSRTCIATSDAKSILGWHLLLFLLVALGTMPLGVYFGLIGFFWLCLSLRGWWLISVWKKAFNTIEQAFPGKGWPFMLRATDDDVLFVASLETEKVHEVIMARAAKEWRWEYLKNCAL